MSWMIFQPVWVLHQLSDLLVRHQPVKYIMCIWCKPKERGLLGFTFSLQCNWFVIGYIGYLLVVNVHILFWFGYFVVLLVKMTLRSAARPRRALARHSGHSRVTCVSLQLHFSFICSSLIHMYFTCGLLGQQSVQWMLHNWLIRALKPAYSKHLPVLWISA